MTETRIGHLQAYSPIDENISYTTVLTSEVKIAIPQLKISEIVSNLDAI